MEILDKRTRQHPNYPAPVEHDRGTVDNVDTVNFDALTDDEAPRPSSGDVFGIEFKAKASLAKEDVGGEQGTVGTIELDEVVVDVEWDENKEEQEKDK